MSNDLAQAYKSYWAAKTREDERAAYLDILRLGGKDGYAMANISRAEAVALIKRQMDGDTDAGGHKANRTHYGYAELRELLDAIYGAPPTSPDEILQTDRWDRQKGRSQP